MDRLEESWPNDIIWKVSRHDHGKLMGWDSAIPSHNLTLVYKWLCCWNVPIIKPNKQRKKCRLVCKTGLILQVIIVEQELPKAQMRAQANTWNHINACFGDKSRVNGLFKKPRLPTCPVRGVECSKEKRHFRFVSHRPLFKMYAWFLTMTAPCSRRNGLSMWWFVS